MKGKSSKMTAIGCAMAMALCASGLNGDMDLEYGQQDCALLLSGAGSRLEMTLDAAYGTGETENGADSDSNAEME